MGAYLRLLIACQVTASLAVAIWRRYKVVLAASASIPLLAVLVDLLKRLGMLEAMTLALTPSSPWGIVTSVVVHGSFQHLHSNLQSFLYASALVISAFLLSDVFIDNVDDAAKAHIRAFAASSALSQVLPSLRLYVEAVTRGARVLAYGMSQLVFGLLGLLASTCASLAPLAALTMVEREIKVPRLHRAVLIASIALSIASIALLVVGFRDFLIALGMGVPLINVRGHVEAFLVGLVASAVILGHGYSGVELTLEKLRSPYSSLRVEEARRRVITRMSRGP